MGDVGAIRKQDWRVPVVERALKALAELTEAGGGSFLARRMAQEAWPALSRLLRCGPRLKPSEDNGVDRQQGSARQMLTGDESGAITQEAAHAPAAVDRVRVAVMRCIAW